MTPEEMKAWYDHGRLKNHFVAIVEDEKSTQVITRCWLPHKQYWLYECQSLEIWEWKHESGYLHDTCQVIPIRKARAS